MEITMNEATGSRVNFLGPLCAIALLAGAMHWMTSSRADAPQSAEAVASVSAFEYYPAQFTMHAAEQADASPTF
jgi:hypothetical protein